MVSRDTGGVIVNVGSISGIRTTNNRSCYGTSKAALNMLTMSLAHELGPKKVIFAAVSSCDKTQVVY
jgi:NAD(P)-dependent dehydrogenase (short-subunit alcohol dehydrogenase family)